MEVASASAFAGTRKATRSLPAAADETASDFWGGRRLRARGKASYGCEQERGKVRDWALTSNEKAAKRFRRFYKLFYVVDRLDETVGFWKDNSDASLQDRKSGGFRRGTGSGDGCSLRRATRHRVLILLHSVGYLLTLVEA